jgi:hypothetical protein
MDVVRYCTPDWLGENFRLYPLNPRFEQEMAKLTTSVAFRVTAEPEWGLEKDILFGGKIDKGKLSKLDFLSEEKARREMDFIMSAPPHEWKKILRKQNKFLTDFMLGKISLEQGSKVGVLAIAPHANTFVEVLTQVALQFPDEMTPEELEAYRSYVKEFREEQGV